LTNSLHTQPKTNPQAPMPTIKGSQMPDSCMPLLRVSVPTLLVAGDADAACPVAALRTAVRAMASPDVRLVVAQVRAFLWCLWCL
jgi:alpha-beta hydrolase superfamily lysophospholipase